MKTTECIYCNRLIRNNNLNRHISVCSGSNDCPVWNSNKTAKSHPELANKILAGGNAFAKSVAYGKNIPGFVSYWKKPENRKLKSIQRIELYKNNPEAHPNRKLAGNRSKMSYPEKLIFDLLVEYNIKFDHNKKIDRFYPDFIIGSLIIEIDGSKWHDANKDAERDKILSELGFTVKRFPVGKDKDLIHRVTTYLKLKKPEV